MNARINGKNLAVQQVGTGSNLGGPTSNPLDITENEINLTSFRDFANRYEELNGGIE